MMAVTHANATLLLHRATVTSYGSCDGGLSSEPLTAESLDVSVEKKESRMKDCKKEGKSRTPAGEVTTVTPAFGTLGGIIGISVGIVPNNDPRGG
ncbi:hypothetical protein Tco_0731041 [Tanacetum coccineum]